MRMTETFIEKSTHNIHIMYVMLCLVMLTKASTDITKSAFCVCFSLALLYFKFKFIKVLQLNY